MKSFLEGRPVVSRNSQVADRSGSQLPNFGQPRAETNGAALAPYVPKRDHGEKTIETVEIDGVVQKIIVTCGCGEKIEVHCAY